MTYTPQRYVSNTDAEMRRLYVFEELSMMRIAKIFDCRVKEVRKALHRVETRLPPKQYADEAFAGMTRRQNILNEQRKGKFVSVSQEQARQLQQTRKKVPVTLAPVSILKEPTA